MFFCIKSITIIGLSLFVSSNIQGQTIKNFSAFVGNLEGGSVRKEPFVVQQGVRLMRRLNEWHWESVHIDSFSVIIVRESDVIFHHLNKESIFDEKLKSSLRTLKSNDRILIFNIHSTDLDQDKNQTVQPIEFLIL